MSSVEDEVKQKKQQVMASGVMLIIVATIWLGIGIGMDHIFDTNLGNIDTKHEVKSMHYDIVDNRTKILVMAAFLWLSLPFCIIHIHDIQVAFDALFTPFAFMKFLYVYCFIIVMFIYCILISVSMVVAAYYSWDFTSRGEIQTTGYYMQLLAVHYTFILSNAATFPACVTAIIPFIVIIEVGWKKGLQYSDGFKDLVLPLVGAKNVICGVLIVIWVNIVVWASFSVMFDWGGSGFYSEYGGSSFLFVCIVISWYAIGLWLIYIGHKFGDLLPKGGKGQYQKIPSGN